MLRINHLLTIVLLMGLILSACQPITRPPVAEPQPPQGLRPDAPPHAVHGPYAVGVRDFALKPTQAYTRPLTISIWYPALNPQGKQEAVIYEMDVTPGGNPPIPGYGHALRDAPPALEGAPYPLVAFSYGGWMWRQSAAYLTEHLASHGFVVIAADHEDNWGTFPNEFSSSVVSRPADLRRTLDYADALTATGGELAGLIDMERVAAGGYSLGGEAALVVGGARLNLDNFFAWCTEKSDPVEECAMYRDHLANIVAKAGLSAPPVGLWPDWSDPRVDALLLLAPSSNNVGAGGTDGVRVPTLFLFGTADTDTYLAFQDFKIFDQLPSAHKTLVQLDNAAHTIFFPACAEAPGFVEIGFYTVCADAVWDVNRAHDLTNHFVTAFLLAELKGDAEAAKALAPENVVFPGIKYETTGFGSEATTAPLALTEVLVTDISDLVGTWQGKFEGYTIYLAFKADGQYTLLYDIMYVEDSGEFVLADGKFRFATATGHCSANPVASYAVQIEQGETAAMYLRFTPVGQDFCAERQTMLTDAPLKFISK